MSDLEKSSRHVPDGSFDFQSEDFEEQLPVEKGPFDFLPTTRHFIPAAVCFLLMTLTSICGWWAPQFWHRDVDLAVSGESIFAKMEYWRLLTALFYHADVEHLLRNAPTLLFFGWILCGYFGWRIFPVLGLAVGVIGHLITVAIYHPATRVIGASGMNYALVSCWLVLYVVFAKEKRVSVKFMRSIAFALMMLFPTTYEPGVSYLAHGTGFLLGIIMGLFTIVVAGPPRNLGPAAPTAAAQNTEISV